jgi:ferrous iron transport protein B
VGDEREPLTIALAGNPNSGKTSIFNMLTGARQHVGNWGGVTVELKEGRACCDDTTVRVIDLPGTYSLSAYSMEEKVTRDYITEARPDVVINVVDASNLERNLYLTVQIMELGVRPILAFNMWDEVTARGLKIDVPRLEQLLDIRIVPTVGKDGRGVKELLREAAVHSRREVGATVKPLSALPTELAAAIENLAGREPVATQPTYPPRWAATKLFEHDEQVEKIIRERPGGEEVLALRDRLAAEVEHWIGEDTQSLIAEARYGFVAGAVKETVRKQLQRVELSDRIDRLLTHPFWAYPVFLAFMWLLFQATFTLGAYPQGWIEALFGGMETVAMRVLPEGLPRSLLVDGVIRGVGGVAVFLPNILILFLGIAIMEDTGYMARTAFIMDKVMHTVGLHGKSFIPMLIGMGCNVPAILATRTLESERDRIKTILLVPLISCSARLPVYVLFAGALFPRHAGNIVFLFQFGLGTLAFFVIGALFTKTLFRGKEQPFVMELPPYRLPTARSVVIHMWERGKHYIKKMGGVVLVFSVVLWFLGTFPRDHAAEAAYDAMVEKVRTEELLSPEHRQSLIAGIRNEQRAHQVESSLIGRIGKALEPVVRPLGFDWRGAVSLVTGFVAKEIVVSSMGVLYAVGVDQTGESESLQRVVARHFTPLAALAFMLFVLLYTPCVVALITVIRELGNWRWSVFAVAYQIAVAWMAGFVVYQGGRLLGLA